MLVGSRAVGQWHFWFAHQTWKLLKGLENRFVRDGRHAGLQVMNRESCFAGEQDQAQGIRNVCASGQAQHALIRMLVYATREHKQDS